MCVCVCVREREGEGERGRESILPPSSASGGLPDEVERTIYWAPSQAPSDPWLATSPVHQAGGKIPPQGRGVYFSGEFGAVKRDQHLHQWIQEQETLEFIKTSL